MNERASHGPRPQSERQADPQFARPARRLRSAPHAMPDGVNSLMRKHSISTTRSDQRFWHKASTMLMVNNAMRYSRTGPSYKVACMPPASHALTAMTPIRKSCAHQTTPSARNVMRPNSSTHRPITTTVQTQRGPNASAAICQQRPT